MKDWVNEKHPVRLFQITVDLEYGFGSFQMLHFQCENIEKIIHLWVLQVNCLVAPYVFENRVKAQKRK